MAHDGLVRDGWLGDRDVSDIARQAVDMLYPPAKVSVEALNPGGRWATWGGMSMAPHRPRRVIVRIAAGNQCVIGINPDWSPTHTLAHLLEALGGACGHQFRGAWFPPCPGHDHAASVVEGVDVVAFRCPDSGATVAMIAPDLVPEP
jgi:hypothetical protein